MSDDQPQVPPDSGDDAFDALTGDPDAWPGLQPPEFDVALMRHKIAAEVASPNLLDAKAELDAFAASVRNLVTIDPALMVTAFRWLPGGRQRIQAAKHSVMGVFVAISNGTVASMLESGDVTVRPAPPGQAEQSDEHADDEQGSDESDDAE